MSENTMKTALVIAIAQHHRRLSVNSDAVPTCAVVLARNALSTKRPGGYVLKIARRNIPGWSEVAAGIVLEAKRKARVEEMAGKEGWGSRAGRGGLALCSC